MPRISADNLPAHRTQQHDALLAAFHRLLGEQGYAAVTLADVASAAGMSRTTVYNYFTDKEALLLAILERDVHALIERATRSVAEAPTASEAMARYIDHQISEFARNDVASHDLLGELGPHGVAGIRQRLAPLSDLHREILERGIAAGEFRPVDIDSTARLISNLIGAERLPVATGERSAEETARLVTDFVSNSLAAVPPTTG